jgi:lysozyme
MLQNPVVVIFVVFLSLGSIAQPDSLSYDIKGIDVSKWNGNIDWEDVLKDGYSFAFIRATQGKKIKDPYFKTNWMKAKEASLVCGAYHFYVTKRKGKVQARKFMRAAEKWEPGDLPPVLDIERLDGGSVEEMRVQLKKWLHLVEKKWHVKPIIYTGDFFYRDYLRGHFTEYPVWIARYRKAGPETENWSFWQFSDKGKVKGISSNADLNRYKGNLDKFCDFVEGKSLKD